MIAARPRAFLLMALLAALPGPAFAHKLKVFATLKQGEITGYAFFVGGGRPNGVPFEIGTAAGDRLAAGRTDAEGGFHWTAPGPGDYVVTVNAEDGHVATASIPAARFDTAAAPPAPPSVSASPALKPSPPAADIEALVTAAVQREILPLREEIEAMDSRLRLTDIVSGVFLILGAAGGVLWLRGGGGRA
jgi:nickel transport protein